MYPSLDQIKAFAAQQGYRLISRPNDSGSENCVECMFHDPKFGCGHSEELSELSEAFRDQFADPISSRDTCVCDTAWRWLRPLGWSMRGWQSEDIIEYPED
jgi:hypothetical protein